MRVWDPTILITPLVLSGHTDRVWAGVMTGSMVVPASSPAATMARCGVWDPDHPDHTLWSCPVTPAGCWRWGDDRGRWSSLHHLRQLGWHGAGVGPGPSRSHPWSCPATPTGGGGGGDDRGHGRPRIISGSHDGTVRVWDPTIPITPPV
ncbi:MAG: hypothetical protein R2705_21325 [Ilumatobacteraceae bacterium]